MTRFETHTFDELSGEQIYDILALRAKVFVVEQQCPYLDPDGRDRVARHVLGFQGSDLVAYARVFPGEPSVIGRVVVSKALRGTGVADELLKEALNHVGKCMIVSISAQAHLQSFYARHGFQAKGDVYLEDEIDHIRMEKLMYN